MKETTPKYILELEQRLGSKIDALGIEIIASTSRGFTAVQKQINSLENRVGSLEVKFSNLEAKFDDLEYKVDDIENTMATKDDVNKILSHIGAYEIRAKNVEDILLHDHKPRIKDLEKEVFAV